MHRSKINNTLLGFTHIPEGHVCDGMNKRPSVQGFAPWTEHEEEGFAGVSSWGFTIIETAVAIAIFAVIITSSLYALHRCMSMLQTAKDINIASSDIRSVCEQLRREVDLTGTIVSRSYALANINTTEQVSITADTTQVPMPVNATITWQEESQRPRSVSVDMLLEQR